MSFPKPLLGVPLALISMEIYFGVIFGYFLGKFLAGQETGQSGRLKSLIFHIGSYRVHLHHWFLGAVLLLSVILFNLALPFPRFSYGFLGGCVIQGIHCYSDWAKILIRKGA